MNRFEFLTTLLTASGLRPQAPAARLAVRPRRPTTSIAPGSHPLGLAEGRDGMLLVPGGYDAALRWPLMLALHGAGGGARQHTRFFWPAAEQRGIVVLSVDARDMTWDAIRGSYGPDVAFIDRALAHAFERCNVDPARVSVEGFSDGASYALGLGLGNGDVFSKIVAFSPGFIPDPGQFHGTPSIFISHGTADGVLPIDRTSRRIVPALRRRALRVTYTEFEGGHTVTPELARRGVEFLLG